MRIPSITVIAASRGLRPLAAQASDPGEITSGIEFPINGAAVGTTRFEFTGANLPAIGSSTILMKVMYRAASGYRTNMFYGRNDGSLPSTGNDFWGMHPYPDPPPNGSDGLFEIATQYQDFTTDDNGNDTSVELDRWYSQVAGSAFVTSQTVLTYLWDLGTSSNRRITRNCGATLTEDTSPALIFGDAPWSPNNERLGGVLRGIAIINGVLTLEQKVALHVKEDDAAMLAEMDALGLTPWYVNMNPTPDDISDKSGEGHNPAWLNSNHGALWTP